MTDADRYGRVLGKGFFPGSLCSTASADRAPEHAARCIRNQLHKTLRTAISHSELHTGAHEVAATIALLRRHVDDIRPREVFARAV
jgi:hypothetical protein